MFFSTIVGICLYIFLCVYRLVARVARTCVCIFFIYFFFFKIKNDSIHHQYGNSSYKKTKIITDYIFLYKFAPLKPNMKTHTHILTFFLKILIMSWGFFFVVSKKFGLRERFWRISGCVWMCGVEVFFFFFGFSGQEEETTTTTHKQYEKEHNLEGWQKKKKRSFFIFWTHKNQKKVTHLFLTNNLWPL